MYTALQREAMPLLRFRSRDHVIVTMAENPTGRTGPRIRCVGRTDDMLIVRGKDTPRAPEGLRSRMIDEIRSRLLVTTDVSFVPHGSLPRETYKSKLVDYSDSDNPAVAKLEE